MPRTRRQRLLAVLAALAAGPALVACGVRYSDPEPGTEFFESIDISGERTAGSPLTVTVGITQTYPVEVISVCELRQNEKTLREIGRDTVPPLTGGNPDATPATSTLTYDLTVEETGTFVVECLTLEDEDNFIAEELKVNAR